MDTSFSSLQGQPLNTNKEFTTNSTASCYICKQPTQPNNSMNCAKCSFHFHLSCANILDNQQSTRICQNCFSKPLQRPFSAAASVCSGSSVSSHSRRNALQLQRLQEEMQLEREYIKKKYHILEQEEKSPDDARTINNSVHDWLDNLPNTVQRSTSENVNINTSLEETQHAFNEMPHATLAQPAISMPLSTFTYSTTISNQNLNTNLIYTTAGQQVGTAFALNTNNTSFINNHANNLLHSTTANVRNVINNNINAEYQPITSSGTPPNFANIDSSFSLNPSFAFQPSNNMNRRITQQQINARQSVPKELPIFSGLPEEWPLFSATYDWSTNVCGLTDAENLIRLQKALRGEALRSVQHILIHPYGVACALSTLKLLYGQPEKILNSLKNKIKALPSLNTNKLNTITSFAVEVKGLETTIRACGLLDELNNSSLLQELIAKMPTYFQLNWGEQKLKLLKTNKKISLTDFANWMFEVGVSASSINVDTNSNTSTSAEHQPRKIKSAFINTHEIKNKKSCMLCLNDCNSVEKCKRFLTADRTERWNIIRKYNLCKQCLKRHNGICNSRVVCSQQGCQIKHHSLLHKLSDDNKETYVTEVNENNIANLHAAHNGNVNNECLFKILPITLYGNNNKSIKTFAFIDEGSSISLINEQLLNELNLEGDPLPLCLKWTGNMSRNEDDSKRLSVQISGTNNKKFSIDVRTVKQLSLPNQSINYKTLSERFPHLKGLPIQDYKNAIPNVLLGLNSLKLCVPTRIREGYKHEPIAICTRLGWILCGNSNVKQNSYNQYNFHACECKQENDKNLNSLIKQFYAIEMTSINNYTPMLGTYDQRAMNILKKYTKQRSDGHYETALLWKYDNIVLPKSYDMAKRRLICLEKTLKNNKNLFEVFEKTISEYIDKKYISKVDDSEKVNTNIWYLPIFPVVNINKPRKTRLVWDAAAKSNGVSLNSMLLKGPDLLSSLSSILFRFRQKHVAVCGDIQQMFHQIYIRENDCHAQRFLWRSCDETKEPKIYVMKVMIFGASCAPCTSQYVKNLNASKFEQQFPLAADAIKNDHYVDDFLASEDTAEQAVKLAKEVQYIHRQGGFNIRNWCSNNHTVLKEMDPGKNINNICINIGDDSEIEKILGVFWVPFDDTITFKLSPTILKSDFLIGNKKPTKREVLKILMSVYDPLGLVGNFLMYLKIVLQEIWRSGVDWDEPILLQQHLKWQNWLKFLPHLKNLKIPRCYLKTFKNYNNLNIQLHTFVDASESGYSAVAYFRISDDDNVVISLIGSKTRVAPLRVVSIPRLELMAAVIGARFANYIIKNHKINVTRKIFWSDSRTVLSWIHSDHRKYHQFVAVRVSEILDSSEINEWFWIPTKMNIADEATKCLKMPNVSENSCWFNGPEFLKLPEQKWPSSVINPTTNIEIRECNLVIQTVEQFINIERFSRWCRALRATAYVYRFCYRLKNKTTHNEVELTQDELCKAETILIKDTQQLSFNYEFECLRQNKKLLKSSTIYKLTPFIDKDGVLRVGGRIDNANVPEELKHPAILPKYCPLTKLLVWHYHCLYRHSNHETVVNEVRQRYYISKLRTVCKRFVKQCQLCKIKNASPQIPQMAKLPRARLGAYLSPFTFTGIDYFGPIFVTVNRHKEKRYGALFTCLTIRAVHIEIVHSLNTSSCIMAIRKFMSRRGHPREFFSDNGTNFIGAERELREVLKEIDKDELLRSITTFNTKWNFNPPSTPHMGGAWERLVRSVKTVFYKIKQERFPNDETLQSMMAEVENIINSRPLSYVPIEGENAEAITPNHFLLGNSNGLKPLASYHDESLVLRESWLCSQQYAQKFWRRWVSEYLPTLTCRTKWFEKAKPISVGDLVIVVDPSNPRNVWPKGKIIEVSMSEDGQVRKAKVMTACGVLERPAVKLAVLDVTHKVE